MYPYERLLLELLVPNVQRIYYPILNQAHFLRTRYIPHTESKQDTVDIATAVAVDAGDSVQWPHRQIHANANPVLL